MRKIIFRGKRKANADWVHGDLSFHRDGRIYIRCWDRSEFSPTYNAYEVDPKTVGQFAGLTDKNGKKIFEGDIIQHGKRKGIIFYYGNFGMFMISWIPNGGANIFMNVLHTEVEVIGNIHDNPELLGGSEDAQ